MVRHVGGVDPPFARLVAGLGRARRVVPCVCRCRRSGELEFDLAAAAAHGADDDLDVVAQSGDQFEQLDFADASELPAGDAGDLVDGSMPSSAAASSWVRRQALMALAISAANCDLRCISAASA